MNTYPIYDSLHFRDRRDAASLRQNHRFHAWSEALSGIVFCAGARVIQYLTIIPLARMSSESIVDYWLRGHEGERKNCFGKIQLVAQKYGENTTFASKTQFSRHRFQLVFEPGAFRY